MYVSTYGKFGQIPTPYTSFAETLGEPPLPPEIQEFLNQVRKSPQNYKKLLLTVTFHPRPMFSEVKISIQKGVPQDLLDVQLMHNLDPPGVFLDELRRIRDDFQKRDPHFKQQIDAELQLRNDMIRIAGDRAMRLGSQTLRPVLVEALLMTDICFNLRNLGTSSAQKILPPDLIQRISNSEVPDVHFTHLGKFLRRYGEVLQTKDPAFKALVETERKRRQQEEQEKQRQRQIEEEQKKRQQRRRRR
jgi:hypothetical protein